MTSASESPPPPTERPEKAGRQTDETYGPLDIEQHVKDDGRVLILYARHTREAE